MQIGTVVKINFPKSDMDKYQDQIGFIIRIDSAGYDVIIHNRCYYFYDDELTIVTDPVIIKQMQVEFIKWKLTQ